ncbi:unnamed protein product [Spodoptera exigua]|nr:unnamed protein product [Spodoptera exigua]
MNAIRNEMNEDIVVEKIRNCMRIYKKLVNVVQDDMVIMKPLMTQSALLEGVIEFIVTTTPALFGELINIRIFVTVSTMIPKLLEATYSSFIHGRIRILWRQMADLRRNFERDLSIARRFENSEEIMMEKIKKCLNDYTKLLDVLNEKSGVTKFWAYKLILTETLMNTVVLLAPAALAEMITNEIDVLRLFVIKQLLVCKVWENHVTARIANSKRKTINDAITFFKQHPFKYTVWRLFTVDGTLILSVIGLLTTYIVAMVQFGHFIV